jgi:hypothetical protein
MATCDRRSSEGVEGRAHTQPEVTQYPPIGAFSPEVMVCACATGTFCITTIVVVQAHGYRRSGRVCACPFPHKYDFVRTHILLMYLHLNNWEFCRVKSENMTLFMLSLIF